MRILSFSEERLERAVGDHLSAHPDTRQVVWLAQPVNSIDATGVDTFIRLRQTLSAQGRRLVVVGLKLPVERVLQAAGELRAGDPHVVLWATEAEAFANLTTTTVQADTIHPSNGSNGGKP